MEFGLLNKMTQSYAVGKAPWETNQSPTGSFAVGSAPWEKGDVSPTDTAIKTPRYDIPVTREDKINKLKEESAIAKSKSDEANSISGFVKNMITSPIVESTPFIGGAIALAKTANKAIDNPFERNRNSIEILNNDQVSLTKQIRVKEKQGLDTTKLKKIYNDNADKIDSLNAESAVASKELPTVGQAVGQTVHTLADVLTAGTYGKATAGMETGILAPKVANLSTGVSQYATGVADLLKKGKNYKQIALDLLKTGAEGAGIGYGYDVATNLESGKTGGEVATPGTMTAVGGLLPIGIKGAMAGENAIRGGISQAIRTYRAFSPNEKAVNQEVDGLRSSWQDFFDRKKSTTKLDARSQAQGKDNARILAEHGYVPEVKNGTIDTTGIYATNNADIKNTSESIQSHLENIDRVAPKTSLTSFQEFRNSIISEIRNDPQFRRAGTTKQVENQASSKLENYAQQYPNGISLGEMNKIRQAMNSPVTGTDAFNKPEFSQDVENVIGNVTRKFIDSKSNSDVVRRVNKQVGDLMSINKLLDPKSKTTINGDKVNFGKVSQYFARVLGAIVGSSTGIPVIGPILGSMGGDFVIKLLNENAFASPIRTAILQELKNSPKLIDQFSKEMSEVEFKALENEIRSTPALPAPAKGATGASVETPIRLGGETTYENPAQKIENQKNYSGVPSIINGENSQGTGVVRDPNTINLPAKTLSTFESEQNKVVQSQRSLTNSTIAPKTNKINNTVRNINMDKTIPSKAKSSQIIEILTRDKKAGNLQAKAVALADDMANNRISRDKFNSEIGKLGKKYEEMVKKLLTKKQND